MAEFLYQNGAKLDNRDSKGRGCLHHAALNDDAGYVCMSEWLCGHMYMDAKADSNFH